MVCGEKQRAADGSGDGFAEHADAVFCVCLEDDIQDFIVGDDVRVDRKSHGDLHRERILVFAVDTGNEVGRAAFDLVVRCAPASFLFVLCFIVPLRFLRTGGIWHGRVL